MGISSPSRVVFYSLATQFENLGDCVINELLLRECLKSTRLVVLCRSVPEWLLKRFTGQEGVILCKTRYSYFSLLFKSVFRRDNVYFFFKPGHMAARQGLKSSVRLLGVTLFCCVVKTTGGSIVRTAVSLDHYVFPERFFQRWIGAMHSCYGVRDEHSLKYAQELGLQKVVYTPDMAFLLPIESVRVSRTGVRRLSVSFRNRPWTSGEATGFSEMLLDIAELAKTTSRVMTVVQQVDFDSELSRRIQQTAKCEIVKFAQNEQAVDDVFKAHRESDLMISNRLHSLLFAWAGGAIPIAVVEKSVDKKIGHLFQLLGLAELVVDSACPEILKEHLKLILQNEESWRSRLRDVFSEQQAILSDRFREIWNNSKSKVE